MKEKLQEVVDGITIKYHANGKTLWSKGKIEEGKAEGYWEWYRIDGTIKRSGYFAKWRTDQGNGRRMTTREHLIR